MPLESVYPDLTILAQDQDYIFDNDTWGGNDIDCVVENDDQQLIDCVGVPVDETWGIYRMSLSLKKPILTNIANPYRFQLWAKVNI